MRHLNALLVCSLFWSTSTVAQDLGSLDRLRATAAQGDAAAQLEMGILYEYGFNLPNNRAYALAWYGLAAAQGNARAVERRDLLQRRMPETEIAEARRIESELTRVQPPEANPPPAQTPARAP